MSKKPRELWEDSEYPCADEVAEYMSGLACELYSPDGTVWLALCARRDAGFLVGAIVRVRDDGEYFASFDCLVDGVDFDTVIVGIFHEEHDLTVRPKDIAIAIHIMEQARNKSRGGPMQFDGAYVCGYKGSVAPIELITAVNEELADIKRIVERKPDAREVAV